MVRVCLCVYVCLCVCAYVRVHLFASRHHHRLFVFASLRRMVPFPHPLLVAFV